MPPRSQRARARRRSRRSRWRPALPAIAVSSRTSARSPSGSRRYDGPVRPITIAASVELAERVHAIRGRARDSGGCAARAWCPASRESARRTASRHRRSSARAPARPSGSRAAPARRPTAAGRISLRSCRGRHVEHGGGAQVRETVFARLAGHGRAPVRATPAPPATLRSVRGMSICVATRRRSSTAASTAAGSPPRSAATIARGDGDTRRGCRSSCSCRRACW